MVELMKHENTTKVFDIAEPDKANFRESILKQALREKFSFERMMSGISDKEFNRMINEVIEECKNGGM
jgi:hypothetical protein